MELKKVDLRQTAWRTCLHAAVILAGILAGAAAAYGADADADTDADDQRITAQGAQSMRTHDVATTHATVDAPSAAVLDSDALRAAASFGHALVAARRVDAPRDPTLLPATPTNESCTAAHAVSTYALVDPMLVPQAATQLAALAALAELAQPAQPLVGTVTLEVTVPGLAVVGDPSTLLPLLIELPEEDGPRRTLARLTMRWARDHHGAVWILSECSIDGLAMLLGRAMAVRLDDGNAAMLRLADTRVLQALRDVLDPEQQQALWGLAAQWRYVDRGAHLQTIEAPQTRADQLGRWWRPLVFSEQQTTELLQAAEPDEVLAYVNRLVGDRLNAMTMPEHHAFAMRQIAAAKALGMHSSQEIGIYAAMALKEGDDFLDQAPWQRALEQVRQGERSWVQVLSSAELQR